MRVNVGLWLARLILALTGCLGSSYALAQSCTFSVTDVNFGTVDPLGGDVDVTAAISGSCSGLPGLVVKICPNIGVGTGGANTTTRFMAQGANTLAYNLYQSGGRGSGSIWGSYLWPYSPRPPRLQINLGLLSGTGTLPVTPLYARVPSGQTGVMPGTYNSVMTGADATFHYQYDTGGNCNSPMLLPFSYTASFNVLANVQGACTVTAADLDFGTRGVLDTNVDTLSNVTVKCPNATPYTVALGPGNAGTGAPSRKMILGAQSVNYDIYRNAGRTLKWSDAVGTTVAGTGTGANQTIPAYGRVPSQTTPGAGAYADTVVVTVSY